VPPENAYVYLPILEANGIGFAYKAREHLTEDDHWFLDNTAQLSAQIAKDRAGIRSVAEEYFRRIQQRKANEANQFHQHDAQ
jgi:hypothetical protein